MVEIVGIIYIIMIIGAVCFVIAFIVEAFKSFFKWVFKLKAVAIAQNTTIITETIDRILEPSHIVTKEEIENILSQNEKTINAVNKICKRRFFRDVLEETGLLDFPQKVSFENLSNSVKDCNRIYDAIQELKEWIKEHTEDCNRLRAINHYITYSEAKQIEELYSKIEPTCKIVPNNYLSDEERSVKTFYDRIWLERSLGNMYFMKNELSVNKTFFDTVLDSYPLDPQQRDSIVKLEDNCSGKTSTILGKAKYLVEKRKIDPAKILLITYTRKAANELHERMKIEGMTCSTFHALAYNIIAQVTGQAPSICDADAPLNVFHKLIETNHSFLHAINNYIIYQQSLMGLEHDYMDAFSYFEDRKKYGIQALFPDVDGKIIFTRSEEEKRLVSILTRLGVPFRYENAYQYNLLFKRACVRVILSTL